jgi:hypothetical protein
MCSRALVRAAAAKKGRQYEAFDAAQPVLASTIVALSVAASAVLAGLGLADEPRRFLETVHKHLTLTTTVPDNGDQNSYTIVVAPVSGGKVQLDDVLIDSFNDLSNLQGLGTTIVDYNPATRQDDAVRRAAAAAATVSWRRRPDHGDDHLPERLGDRRQHAQQ